MATIVILELPTWEELTPEELEAIFGAGRTLFKRLGFESLEERRLMSASPNSLVSSPVISPTVLVGSSTPGIGAGINHAPSINPTVNSAIILNMPTVVSLANNSSTIRVSDLLKSGSGIPITDVDAGAQSGIAITSVNNALGSWQYSIDNGANWKDLSGSISSARLLSADTSTMVRFTPRSGVSGTMFPGISFYAWDQTSGKNGDTADLSKRGGTTAFSNTTAFVKVVVTANHAPVVTAAATFSMPSVVSLAGKSSTLSIAELLKTGAVGTISDVDTGAKQGIAVTTVSPVGGTWQYSLDRGTTWNGLTGSSNTAARLLAADDNTLVRFTPTVGYAGTILTGLTVRGWDQTTGKSGDVANISTIGGTTAFSSSVAVVKAVVTANRAPTVTAGATFSMPKVLSLAGNSSTLSVAELLKTGAVGTISDVDTGAKQGIAVTTVSPVGGTWQFSLDRGTTWNGLTGSNNTSARLLAADDNTLVRFTPIVGYSGPQSLRFRVWDQTTGKNGDAVNVTAVGGTSAFSTAIASAIVTVTANSAPVLRTDVVLSMPAVVSIAGNSSTTRVADLLNSGKVAPISDLDSTNSRGIAVTTAASGGGSWQFSLDSGTTWNVVQTSSTVARLLAADANTFLRFTPTVGYSGSPNPLQFRAWDQTTGKNGDAVNITAVGGTSAFSTAIASATVAVTANHAPVVAASATFTMPSVISLAGNSSTLSVVELLKTGAVGTISDVDTGAKQGIAVTTVSPVGGTWQYSLDRGTTWNGLTGSSNTAARLLAADDNTLVRFTPTVGYAGTILTGLTVRGWDQTTGKSGDVANILTIGGTTAFSSSVAVVKAVVTANHAPMVSAGAIFSMPTVMSLSGNNSTLSVAELLARNATAISDVDTGAKRGIAVVGADTTNGSWQYSLDQGVTWSAMGVTASSARLLAADDGAFLRYTPNVGYSGTVNLAFRVWDQTAGKSGDTFTFTAAPNASSAFSSTTAVATVVVTANHAPVVTAGATFNMPAVVNKPGNSSTILVSDLLATSTSSITDVDAGAKRGIAVTAVDSSNGTWRYSLDRGVTWNALTGSATSARLLAADNNTIIQFTPEIGYVGTAPLGLTFRAWDQATGMNGDTADTKSYGDTTAFSKVVSTVSVEVDSDMPAVDLLNSSKGLSRGLTTSYIPQDGLPDTATEGGAYIGKDNHYYYAPNSGYWVGYSESGSYDSYRRIGVIEDPGNHRIYTFVFNIIRINGEVSWGAYRDISGALAPKYASNFQPQFPPPPAPPDTGPVVTLPSKSDVQRLAEFGINVDTNKSLTGEIGEFAGNLAIVAAELSKLQWVPAQIFGVIVRVPISDDGFLGLSGALDDLWGTKVFAWVRDKYCDASRFIHNSMSTGSEYLSKEIANKMYCTPSDQKDNTLLGATSSGIALYKLHDGVLICIQKADSVNRTESKQVIATSNIPAKPGISNITGHFRAITVTPQNGAVFALDADNNLFFIQGSQKWQVASNIQAISVNKDNTLNVSYSNGTVAKISTTPDGKSVLWADQNGTLRLSGSIAEQSLVIADNVKSFNLSDDGSIVVKGAFAASSTSQSVGSGYALGTDGRLWQLTSDTSTRIWIDNSVLSFSRTSKGELLVLGSDHNLWKESSGWLFKGRTWCDGNVITFEDAGNSYFYALGTDGNLWYEQIGWKQSGRSKLDGNVRGFALDTDGFMFVEGTDGKLWHQRSGVDRVLVTSNASSLVTVQNGKLNFTFAPTAASETAPEGIRYVLSTDGILWKCDGDTKRQWVDSNVRAFAASSAGVLYVLGTDHTLWRESFGWQVSGRTKLDGDVQGFALGANGYLYVQGTDGKLWHERSGSDRVLMTGNAKSLVTETNGKLSINYAPTVSSRATLDGNSYILGIDGVLWKSFNGQSTRQWVDSNVQLFETDAGNAILVLGNDGNLWRESIFWQQSGRTRVDGNVLSFSNSSDGNFYVLGTDKNLWRIKNGETEATRSWVDGNVLGFAPDGNGFLYVQGTDGNLWHERSASDRVLVTSNAQALVTVVNGKLSISSFAPTAMSETASDGTRYILGTDGMLWKCGNDPSTRLWVDSNVRSFATSSAGTLYVLGTDRNLWRESIGWQQSGRTKLDGNVQGFALSANGYLYVQGTDGKLWYERSGSDRVLMTSNAQSIANESSGKLSFTYAPTAASEHATNGCYYILGTDGILWLCGDQNTRQWVDSNVRAFATDGSTIYVLSTDRNLWKESSEWFLTGRTWLDGNVAGFTLGTNGYLYVKGTDGKLWYEKSNNERVMVTSNAQSLVSESNGKLSTPFYAPTAVSRSASDGSRYVLGTDGILWKCIDGQIARQWVDSNVMTFETDGGYLYVLGSDRNLWREVMGWQQTGRTWLDGNVLSFRLNDGYSIYVLGTDRNLWLESVEGQAKSGRTWVDGNVLDYRVASNGYLYVLGTDHNLWYETIGWQSRGRYLAGRNIYW